LKPLLAKRGDALWSAYITAETRRSKQEAEALIRLLASQYLAANVGDDAAHDAVMFLNVHLVP
jgi:hypothetical protein